MLKVVIGLCAVLACMMIGGVEGTVEEEKKITFLNVPGEYAPKIK